MKWKRSEFTTETVNNRTIFQYAAKSNSDKWDNRTWHIICNYHHKGSGSSLEVQYSPQSRRQEIGDFPSLTIAKEMAEILDKNMINV